LRRKHRLDRRPKFDSGGVWRHCVRMSRESEDNR
jgi:hypothetical protein